MDSTNYWKIGDFDYDLPQELIAQTPIEPRDSSRLLVVNRASGTLEHRHFHDIGAYLRPGDLLIANQSRVIPARLLGRRAETGTRPQLRRRAEPGGEDAGVAFVAGRAADGAGSRPARRRALSAAGRRRRCEEGGQ